MRNLAISTIVLSILVGSAAAATVSFSASGTFSGADGSLNPALIGQTFRFDIAYEADTLEAGSYSFGSTQVAYYDLTSFVATIGETSYDLDFFPSVTVTADPTGSSFQSMGSVHPTETYEGLLFNLDFKPAVSLASPSLPASIDGFGAVTLAQYRDIEGRGEFFTAGRTFSSTASVRAVPEPASIAALGLGALAIVRRRKRAYLP